MKTRTMDCQFHFEKSKLRQFVLSKIQGIRVCSLLHSFIMLIILIVFAYSLDLLEYRLLRKRAILDEEYTQCLESPFTCRNASTSRDLGNNDHPSQLASSNIKSQPGGSENKELEDFLPLINRSPSTMGGIANSIILFLKFAIILSILLTIARIFFLFHEKNPFYEEIKNIIEKLSPKDSTVSSPVIQRILVGSFVPVLASSAIAVVSFGLTVGPIVRTADPDNPNINSNETQLIQIINKLTDGGMKRQPDYTKDIKNLSESLTSIDRTMRTRGNLQ